MMTTGFIGGCSAGRPKDASKQSLAQHDLGVDAFSKGNLRGALTHAQRAVELDPENADAQLLVATVLIGFCSYSPDECRLDEAERAARAALKAKPEFREARNTLGSVLINAKKYDDAIATLKPLTEDMLYATPEIAWGNLGWAQLEKGDLDGAVTSLTRAIALQPQFCWGGLKLALTYEKRGDLGTAEVTLTRAIDTDKPQCKAFPDLFEVRARVRQRLGDAVGAKEDLDRCKKVGDGTPSGRRCAAGGGS